jgi:ferritin-like metal-binding protein YciE
MNHSRKPGLDQFWEHADGTGSAQHPLERELDERTDALARYRRLIDEAEANGREEAAEILLRQHDREAASVERLRAALATREHWER